MMLETKRCIVRPFHLSDVDDLYEVLSNPRGYEVHRTSIYL